MKDDNYERLLQIIHQSWQSAISEYPEDITCHCKSCDRGLQKVETVFIGRNIEVD